MILAHGGAVVESLCCAKVPLLEDEAVVAGHLKARRDADALYVPPKQATIVLRGVVERELDARRARIDHGARASDGQIELRGIPAGVRM